jgi:3-methyladenine DNA glycosylase AlkD
MTVPELAAEVRRQMAAHADPRFAEGARNFFKEAVDPWGVRSADLKTIEKMVCRVWKNWTSSERNRFCSDMWRSGKFEEGVLVSHVYRRFLTGCGPCEWKLFERWIDRYVRNWAHCDGVSSWLLAGCIGNEPQLREELPPWTASSNRWKRRAAAVALLQEAKLGRSTEAIFLMAEALKTDSDEMVQKGIGWLLKETYPKHPETTVEYLHAWTGPRLVVRYAAEKMTKPHRAEFGLK